MPSQHTVVGAAPLDELFSRLDGYRGLVSLPGTSRNVWWTGRVAIGLRFEPRPSRGAPLAASERWIQDQLLAARHAGAFVNPGRSPRPA